MPALRRKKPRHNVATYCLARSLSGVRKRELGAARGSLSSPGIAEQKVVAEEAIGMIEAAGDRINAGGFAISCFGHPAT